MQRLLRPWKQKRAAQPDVPYYTHDPLPGDSTHLRILELLPAEGKSDTLEGVLHIEPLNGESRPYEALSYVWGEQRPQRSMTIQGQNLIIGPNLDDALRTLRWKDTSRWLWIDALCIDQLNPAERSAQVSRMTSIYRTAQRTLEWLGDPRHAAYRPRLSSHVMVNFLQELSDEGSTWEYYDEVEVGHRRYFDSPCYSKPGGAPIINQRDINFVLQLPYFQRRWIVQEICVASEVEFWYGDAKIAAPSFAKAVVRLNRDHSVVSAFNLWAYIATRASTFTGSFSSEGCSAAMPSSSHSHTMGDEALSGIKLLDALQDFRGFKCGDPRDRIAALNFLSNPELEFDIDYQNSTEHEFRRFALAVMKLSTTAAARLIVAAAEQAIHRQLRKRRGVLRPGSASWIPTWDEWPRETETAHIPRPPKPGKSLEKGVTFIFLNESSNIQVDYVGKWILHLTMENLLVTFHPPTKVAQSHSVVEPGHPNVEAGDIILCLEAFCPWKSPNRWFAYKSFSSKVLDVMLATYSAMVLRKIRDSYNRFEIVSAIWVAITHLPPIEEWHLMAKVDLFLI